MTDGVQMKIWDSADALKRVMGKEDILKILIEAFLVDLPSYLKTLGDELQQNDISAASKSAHAIKGVAGNLSTLALADLSSDIEQDCLNEKPVAEILSKYEQLNDTFTTTCSALKAWLIGHS